MRSTGAAKLGKALVIMAILAILVALLVPFGSRVGPEAARSIACTNNLTQIALALRSYAASHGALPPAYTCDAEGNRLHSWRTLLLPYFDMRSLYDTIDLSRPWDDPANEQARRHAIDIYQCPSADLKPGFTTYLAVVHPDGAFTGSQGRPLGDWADEAAGTLLVIDAPPEQAVHWMSPQDADETLLLSINEHTRLPHPDALKAAMADGHVDRLDPTTAAAERRELLMIAGDEALPE